MNRPFRFENAQASPSSTIQRTFSGGCDGQVRPATEYRNPGDLCVILCLFNLGRSQEKRQNFASCHALLQKSGIPSVTVDCVSGDDPWILRPSAQVLRLRASATLWQKERLINRALAYVPDQCSKVAWIDADILFENPDWAVSASQLLDNLAVVQLADRIIRPPRGSQVFKGPGRGWESFAAVYAKQPNAMLAGAIERHGHPGFGWAAQRTILEQTGLYDGCVTGGGDHVMAHAFCGDWESRCLTLMMGADTAWYRHAVAWALKTYPLVRARVGVVAGAALHLWHGDLISRHYDFRYEALRDARFDPNNDLEPDQQGCWCWASNKPQLHAAISNYLAIRRVEADSITHLQES